MPITQQVHHQRQFKKENIKIVLEPDHWPSVEAQLRGEECAPEGPNEGQMGTRRKKGEGNDETNCLPKLAQN